MVDMKPKKQTLFFFFLTFCRERLIPTSVRHSPNSTYVEVAYGKKVFLVRFSDHPYSRKHSWSPDFDVQANRDLKDVKKFFKKMMVSVESAA